MRKFSLDNRSFSKPTIWIAISIH